MTQEQKTRIEEHHDRLYHIATVDNIPDDIRDALKAAYLAGAAYALDIYCPHWISVEDKLPNDGDYVLICNNRGLMTTSLYEDEEWVISETYLAVNVTHWMPLPQAPHHFADASKKVEEGGDNG